MLARAVKLILRRSFAGAVGLLARPLQPSARFILLTDLGRSLVPQYRFKWPAMAWWHDEPFNRYLARFGELDLPNADRRLMLGELLRLAHDVPGDTAAGATTRIASSQQASRLPSQVAMLVNELV